MVNKKGFVHTIEAVIAIVILLIFIFTALPGEKIEQTTPDNIKLIQEKITSEIESNTSLRNSILLYPFPSQLLPPNLETLEQNRYRQQLTSFIKNAINLQTINFDYTVCDAQNTNCAPDFLNPVNADLYVQLPNKDIYAKSIMIANATAQRVFRL